MLVKILDGTTGLPVEAYIRAAKAAEMPSMHDGWRFNFDKHAKKAGAKPYVLVTKGEPSVIQGALIFELKNKEIPYMAYVEVAPHNKGVNKKYDHVAGCLIAFAFGLSLPDSIGMYKGLLFFDVKEKDPADTIKLMAVYSKKYFAKRCSETQMLIADEDGEKLMKTYLP